MSASFTHPNYMISQIFTIIYISFLLVGASYVIRLMISYLWIIRSRRSTSLRTQKRKIYIIIPVLDETSRLPKTCDYFYRNFYQKDIKLIIVTTNKEISFYKNKIHMLIDNVKAIESIAGLKEFANKLHINVENNIPVRQLKQNVISKIRKLENTIDCTNALKDRYKDFILTYNYPRVDGKMAHQINYSINRILKDYKCEPNTLFAIYNADSEPDRKTFEYVNNYPARNTNNLVFQQYGNYYKNFGPINKLNIKGAILSSAAVWQTKWSIAVEIFNALLQSPAKHFPAWLKRYLYPANYCIGHGLFVTKQVFERIGGFSETTHNEDAEFGLELSYFGIPIIPIPYFDMSDSPDSVKSLYLQKSGWFFNPLQSFKYFELVIKKYSKIPIDKVRLALITSQFFLYAIYWLIGPTALFLLLVLCFIEPANISFFFLAYLSYLVVPSIISWFIIKTIDNREAVLYSPNGKTLINISIGSIFSYFLHGLSAYRTIIILLRNYFTGSVIEKNKTEMEM